MNHSATGLTSNEGLQTRSQGGLAFINMHIFPALPWTIRLLYHKAFLLTYIDSCGEFEPGVPHQHLLRISPPYLNASHWRAKHILIYRTIFEKNANMWYWSEMLLSRSSAVIFSAVDLACCFCITRIPVNSWSDRSWRGVSRVCRSWVRLGFAWSVWTSVGETKAAKCCRTWLGNRPEGVADSRNPCGRNTSIRTDMTPNNGDRNHVHLNWNVAQCSTSTWQCGRFAVDTPVPLTTSCSKPLRKPTNGLGTVQCPNTFLPFTGPWPLSLRCLASRENRKGNMNVDMQAEDVVIHR